MNMIVAYDIADPKRLSKVAKIMLDYGVRVQKSIFEVALTGVVFAEMKERIEKIIVHDEDGVKYFPVCEKCAGTVEIIGQGEFTDPDHEYYIY
ncbi:MAG: CRISPR-associated endonuclease Cas2 [Thermodesulfobacteriota bacterium]